MKEINIMSAVVKPEDPLTIFEVGARIRNYEKNTVITVASIENEVISFVEETETGTYISKINPESEIKRVSILNFMEFLEKNGYVI